MTLSLRSGWSLLDAPPGQYQGPEQLPGAGWLPAVVPGTVAQSLDLPLDTGRDIEASDWWYRCRFSRPEEALGVAQRLRFEGLATLAEVWLNGAPLLSARNMFRAYAAPAPLRDDNELVIVFRSIDAALKARRPRPRWRTALVDNQRLRFVRTSLLGRIPGWTPRLPPIGPWREVVLEPAPAVTQLRLRAGAEGTTGRLRLSALAAPGAELQAAALLVGDARYPVDLDGGALRADLRLPEVPLWWPHTHGEPHLVGCRLELTGAAGASEIDLGPVGFREIAIDRSGGWVRLVVNGRPVFCRGACWSAEDVRSLDGAPGQTARTLRSAREGGLNMLRVGGTMTYGSDALYRSCDALGILVWQDFMFANMDYPFEDPGFREEAEAEVTEQLRRLSRHPCVAIYCGGSEVQQQAAMLGLPPEQWSDPFFEETLPALCAEEHPGVGYFPSTPCEGPLPFHTDVGISHYFGVGAYRRPLEDARRAGVRFTPECLGFANVPEGEALPAPHHPAWKAGVPRDAGAGWDFDDIRDHYLAALFGVDPFALRAVDPERYLALSRAVSGEVMLRVFAEWRRPGSGCGGGLVWFLKDLRPGAGWGILDSLGQPKAPWWVLRRAWARRAVLLTDEGLNGVAIHLLNETAEPLAGEVELALLRGGRALQTASAPAEVAPFGAVTLSGDALLGGFFDAAHAYRFGPPAHDVVVARLRAAGDRAVLSEDALFPGGHSLPRQPLTAVKADAVADGGDVVVTLEAEVFLQSVSVQCRGYIPEDNFFHLSPGLPRSLRFSAEPGARAFKAYVSALNLEGSLTVRS